MSLYDRLYNAFIKCHKDSLSMQAIQKKTNEFWVPLRDEYKKNPKDLERLTLLKIEELCQIGTKKSARLLNFFEKVSEVGGCCETIRSFFDFNQVKETFSIVFQKGKNHRRLRVILIAICSFLVFGVITGETAINYLFMRFRFNWDALEFSIFSTYDVIVHFIGTLFAISFFSRYLHWNDALIAIIALLGKLFSTSIYVFATEKWMIYTAPVVEIFRGASTVAIRSMGSKLVSSENLGKLYSIFGLIEAAVPIIFGPIYAKTYAATLDVLPGAIYVLGAAISIPVISIFGYLIYLGQGGVKETTPCLNRPE